MSANDTIVAPASGVGRAAIAVIRISGPSTRDLLEALCGGVPPPRQHVPEGEAPEVAPAGALATAEGEVAEAPLDQVVRGQPGDGGVVAVHGRQVEADDLAPQLDDRRPGRH